MDDTRRVAAEDSNHATREDRLDSWKKIASYLKRDVSTVQRWERREGLPVHRHLHDKQGSVFAFRGELDLWWEGRRSGLSRTEAQEDGTSAAPPGAADAPDAPDAPSPDARWPLFAALAAAAAVAALAWFQVHRDAPWHNPLEEARFTRLTDFPGPAQAAALSRDGRWVAFLGEQDGRTDAWVSELGSGHYLDLTRTLSLELVNPSIRTLGFSPDAAQVAIWTRGADGSRPEAVNIIAMPTGGGSVTPFLAGVAEFDWAHDGKRLIYHTTAPGDPLFVRENGRQDRKIYAGPAGVHCHFPVWSLTDDYVYFIRGVPPDDWDLWRVHPSGGEAEPLTHQHARLSYPVVLDRHNLAYLATDPDGSGPWMYVVDPDRGTPHRISSGAETFSSLAASADGRKLIATLSSAHHSVWRLPLARQPADSAAPAAPQRLMGNAAAPRLAGSALIYVSASGGTEGIWIRRADNAHQLWRSARAHVLGAPAIAEDGQHVAFITAEDGRTALNVMDLDGSHFRRISDSLQLRGSAAWFADGQSLLAAVIRDGEPRLTRVFLDGEPPVPFVAEYSTDPVWSPDHRFVVYSGADIGTTFPLRAAAADGRPYPIAGVMLTRGARRVAFDPNSGSLVILDGEIGHKNLWLLTLESGARRLLAQLPPDAQVRDFDVSASGSEIVFDQLEASSEMAIIDRPAP